MKHVDGYTAGENTAAKKNISTSDLIHFSGNWVWRAVEALVGASDFKSDPVWIANRLNISAEAAKDAIEGLVRIGLISLSDGKIESKSQYIEARCNNLERSDLFHIHEKIKAKISEKMSHRDCYSNNIVLTKGKYMNDFYSKFLGLVDDLIKKSAEDKDVTDVFALELSMIRVTRDRE